jgi:hypothetical protein
MEVLLQQLVRTGTRVMTGLMPLVTGRRRRMVKVSQPVPHTSSM